MANSAGVGTASLATFVMENFEFTKQEAYSFENRIVVPEEQAPEIIEAFKEGTEEAVKKAKATIAKNKAESMVQNMPHTSTPSFEGYRIARYGGFATGTATINTASGLLWSSQSRVEDSIDIARIQAIQNLKQKAFDMDCNAVFVSVDSHGVLNTQNNSHYLMVCANGTAVEIEPI